LPLEQDCMHHDAYNLENLKNYVCVCMCTNVMGVCNAQGVHGWTQAREGWWGIDKKFF
jgi:hypothetical protein